jgi:Protein of unknown function (DUF664)
VALGEGLADSAGMTSSEAASGPVATRWTKLTVYPDMWIDPDDDPRETDVETVDERSTLLDYLRYYRLTMEMKCAGLDAEQLARRSVPPSTMSLLGAGAAPGRGRATPSPGDGRRGRAEALLHRRGP